MISTKNDFKLDEEVSRLRDLMKINRYENAKYVFYQTCMLYFMGYNKKTISLITGMSRVTIDKYIEIHRIDPTLSKPHLVPGPNCKLSNNELKEFKKIIKDNSYTIKQLINIAKEKYNISYSDKGMRKLIDKHNLNSEILIGGKNYR
ncbi:hypothetical protein IQ283_08300 (plasmid) [Alkalihalobacillus hwajinpoensis]|uniref:hypothetical protein n=1 Tax=Guptibacillus hwajinpoensis TaxID=208199 RepID=UPI0018839A07|nr:hypothetical protein [Pseudalkalibacillus hwajinpoensis]MBF0706610.1 hypothetical protein [Pseudalkalibacillus hwajinpoensis]